MTRGHKAASSFSQTAINVFAANERINQLVLTQLDPAVWSTKPTGNVRSIAAIVTHMHNIRLKWIRLTAPYLQRPSQLKRTDCTQQQAREALAGSATCCIAMLADALGPS